MITLPIFKIGVSESEIVEEVCSYFKNKRHCIPPKALDGMIVAMYLNIIEYIDTEKQDKLMEDINMNESCDGLLATLRNQGIQEGIQKGTKRVLLSMLETFSISEVSEYSKISEEEILEIISSD